VGIYYSDLEKDAAIIHQILTESLADWNRRFAEIEGVLLALKAPAAERISSLGNMVLTANFPELPDAYKRVATLLVTMALHPFIIGRRKDGDGVYTEIIHGQVLRNYGIIMGVDSIGQFLYPFEQWNTAENGWVQLNNWPGFPSEEAKNELANLISTYAHSGLVTFDKANEKMLLYDQRKLYQAVLSVSLIVKQRYSV
jgi:hypothetical protein